MKQADKARPKEIVFQQNKSGCKTFLGVQNGRKSPFDQTNSGGSPSMASTDTNVVSQEPVVSPFRTTEYDFFVV